MIDIIGWNIAEMGIAKNKSRNIFKGFQIVLQDMWVEKNESEWIGKWKIGNG